MASDDFYNIYSDMFMLNKIKKLLKKAEKEHSMEYIVLTMLNLQKDNPDLRPGDIVKLAKKELL